MKRLVNLMEVAAACARRSILTMTMADPDMMADLVRTERTAKMEHLVVLDVTVLTVLTELMALLVNQAMMVLMVALA